MSYEKKRVHVSLTGGLGNQLFQLAAGLNLAGRGHLSLLTTLGAPRSSREGIPDLLSFAMPQGIEILSGERANWITRKTTGFMLRKGIAPTFIERNKIYSSVLQAVANLIISIYFKGKISISSLNGVGYWPIGTIRSGTLLVGYFQSYRWASDPIVKKKLQSMTLSNETKLVGQYRADAETELPLIVHVRLGDYVAEKNFGIPSKEYYERGISKILATGRCKSIWLFSDELEKACEYLPKDLHIPIRMIPEIDGSPAATLEVMRFGAGYVIANSSFSWWAAFLSMNPDVEVIAPQPWFQGMDEPSDLIPSNWQRIDAGYLRTTP